MFSNKCTFLLVLSFSRKDPTYPERAYFANDQSEFKYTYKLPEGVCGEKVLVQWRYITANSCFPPGYKNTAVGDRLQELGWLRAYGMSDCLLPYDPTGATGAEKPEQFWNCAEITINCANPTVSPAPSPPPQPTPVTTFAPIGSPTGSPVGQPTFAYCNYGGTHDTSRKYHTLFIAWVVDLVFFSNIIFAT